MGTRSITHIHEMKSLDSKEKITCSFFRHFDGYIDGHGVDLAEWLTGKGLKNGKGSDFIEGTHFNRAGTMAVKLCNYIQDESGCEIIPTGESIPYIDFEYHIYFDEVFYIKIISYGKEIKVSVPEFDAIKLNEIFSDDED